MDLEEKKELILYYFRAYKDVFKLHNMELIYEDVDTFRGRAELQFSHDLEYHPCNACETNLTISFQNYIAISILIQDLIKEYSKDEILEVCNKLAADGLPYNFVINIDNDLVLRLYYYYNNSNEDFYPIVKLLANALENVEKLYLPELERLHQFKLMEEKRLRQLRLDELKHSIELEFGNNNNNNNKLNEGNALSQYINDSLNSIKIWIKSIINK